ncbi:hypothetical protein SLS60_005065 [Paraconiothyrium brasiliense]|uniref:TPR-like protein n=1 Tax=Paraconiothyrium brasiliense TaxID=300254 RepID=A0ABR3RH08_9PLEO
MAQSGISTTFSGDRNQGLQPSCFVPFRRDPDFIPRGTLLDQIRQRCAAPASRVALVGIGGVGYVLQQKHFQAEPSPKTWVFWAHASNTARLEQSFREIANQAKVRGRNDPQADVFKLVHDWLRDEKNGPWLLVLDNADDAAVLSPPPSNTDADNDSNSNNATLRRQLSRYIPPSTHGSVLVTSRTRRAATQIVEDDDVILIEPMHSAAASALLDKKLGDKVDRTKDIAELAAALDYMPLALVQAAAYIRKRAPRCSVRKYLEEYRQSDSTKTSLLNQEAGHLRRDETASNSVLITWQISFDHIRSTRRSAADLLSLMSFFDRQGIQDSLLRRNTNVPDNIFFDDILVLRDYTFIKSTGDANIFEMHSLVQLATRKWLENQGQVDKWRTQFIFHLAAELPNGQYENWEKCQALFPHARAALAQRPQDEDSLKKWALLLLKAARYALEQGRAGEAEHMSMVSMEVNREVCGEESGQTLSSMSIVGLARSNRGKYKEAESIQRQTLALCKKVLGQEHPGTLASINNLAHVLDSQGKYEEAKLLFRQTLVLKERLLGREHIETLISMGSLAVVLSSLGEHNEAELMSRQALVLREKVLGREHPDTVVSMSCLAAVLGDQGKFEEAELICRQTLELREKVLGREHPNTLLSMHNLAVILREQGKFEEAELIHRRTLVLQETILGCEHQDTLELQYTQRQDIEAGAGASEDCI